MAVTQNLITDESVSSIVKNLSSHAGLSIGRYTVGSLLDKMQDLEDDNRISKEEVSHLQRVIRQKKDEIDELTTRLGISGLSTEVSETKPAQDPEAVDVAALVDEVAKLRSERLDFLAGVDAALEKIRLQECRVDKLFKQERGPENIMLRLRNRTFDSLDILASYRGGCTISAPTGRGDGVVYVAWDGDVTRDEFDLTLLSLINDPAEEEGGEVSDTEVVSEEPEVTQPEAVGNLP